MKTTYWVWKDPDCIGVNPDWHEITGREFLALVRSPESKGRYFIKMPSASADGGDGNIVMESTREQYKIWKKEKNHSDYLRRCNEGYTVLSYHSLESEDGCHGEETLVDKAISIEEDCFFTMDKQALRAALEKLTEDEYRLITYLYLSDKQGTERGYMELAGLAKTTVHDMKIRAFKKLKKFFEK